MIVTEKISFSKIGFSYVCIARVTALPRTAVCVKYTALEVSEN